jgi:hypothetical protein
MQLGVELGSTLESRAASDNGSGIHSNPVEGMVPFDSQPWDDRFMPLSSIEFGPLIEGQSFNTYENAMETFSLPDAPNMWDNQPRLYDSSSGSLAETPHGHARHTTPIYENTHNSGVLPDNWDMATSFYPQPSHLLNSQPSLTVHEASRAEVDHPYPRTMDNHGSHSTALYPTMTFAQTSNVQSIQTSTNLNFTDEGRSAFYSLSALPSRPSALSTSSELEGPSSSPAKDSTCTSWKALDWS